MEPDGGVTIEVLGITEKRRRKQPVTRFTALVLFQVVGSTGELGYVIHDMSNQEIKNLKAENTFDQALRNEIKSIARMMWGDRARKLPYDGGR